MMRMIHDIVNLTVREKKNFYSFNMLMQCKKTHNIRCLDYLYSLSIVKMHGLILR
jgi:hypothetical protein